MEVGSRIKELRNSMHISQQELADKLGVDRSTIGKYETGARMPDLNMFEKIADLFDVTADELLGRDK